MPKIKSNIKSKICEIVRKHSNELEISGEKLFCKLCLVEIPFNHKHGKHNVSQHFSTSRHINKKADKVGNQPFIDNAIRSGEEVYMRNEFFEDLTKTFIECNIPFMTN
jgi:hypothetical protein